MLLCLFLFIYLEFEKIICVFLHIFLGSVCYFMTNEDFAQNTWLLCNQPDDIKGKSRSMAPEVTFFTGSKETSEVHLE